METTAIIILFAAAAFYLGRKIYAQFQARSGCSKNCGGACSVPSVMDKIEMQEKSIH